MNNIKKSCTLVLFFFCISIVGYAQSASAEKKAEDRVESINKAIVSVNPDLALTPEQKSEIKESHIERTKLMKTVNKTALTEEEKTQEKNAAIKKFNQKLNNEILTKEQRNAKREAKSKE